MSKIHQANKLSTEDTPRIKLKVRTSKKLKPFSIKALPDSGATKTIIAYDIAQSHNIPIKGTKDKLFAANDTQLRCEGRCTLWLDEIKTEALVSSSLKSELIVSWTDLVRLDIIPADFPARQTHAHAHHASPIKATDELQMDDIIDEFSDVLPVSYTHLTLPTTPYV